MNFEDLTISDSIYLQRKRLKVSQDKLARAAGVSRNYISLIERGKTDGLTIGTLEKICRALGLSVDITIEKREADIKAARRLCDEFMAAYAAE